ncbi:polysaccharide deacetylase family protein [Maribacter flavus]|uniref:Polysaccharide deacetylase family protein n=1 Tax=Maribacter flavus TaxID=1658664 RepID=A0A5B2TPV7_9FLAO|nr:hypothetical protein [Maribacter flavus]KAA2216537.1 hypothetical protein F0361_11065 [Maribacter flavus]
MDGKTDKVYVLFEDDIEILGNGQGHVFYRQYLPILQYVELLKKYRIKSSFYVDMAHLLFLRKNAAIKDFGLQADYIEKTIEHLLQCNMEVQLHLHPQWVNARMENDEIKVADEWNIGQLSENDQTELVRKSLSYLNDVIEKTNITNPITSFRTGSWGIQPFQNLFETFNEVGIKTVLGPVKGLKIPRLAIDYSNMESDTVPYYCDKTDCNKIGIEKGAIVVPMTPTFLNWIDLGRYYLHSKFKSIKKTYDKDLDLNKKVLNTKYIDPTEGKDRITLSLRPFKTHLKMNAQPFWLLKKTFKRSFDYVMGNDNGFKLIVVETHSKDFKNNFDAIERFFDHLNNAYDGLEFITANSLWDAIEKQTVKPLVKNQ